jgi:hypothetical protein
MTTARLPVSRAIELSERSDNLTLVPPQRTSKPRSRFATGRPHGDRAASRTRYLTDSLYVCQPTSGPIHGRSSVSLWASAQKGNIGKRPSSRNVSAALDEAA